MDLLTNLDHKRTEWSRWSRRLSQSNWPRFGDYESLHLYEATILGSAKAFDRDHQPLALDHFAQVKGDLVYRFADITEKTAMVALQGPKVMDALAGFSKEIPTLKRYRFTEKSLFIAKFLVSRTGYTGEDGVEVILPASMAGKAVEMILKNMDDGAIMPCGLGARDSLRLEAGMALYGHEIDETIDPLTAGLDFAVSLEKGGDGFIAVSYTHLTLPTKA